MSDRPAILVSRSAMEIAFALLSWPSGRPSSSGALEFSIGWGEIGPEAGYFPFRIGTLIVLASLRQPRPGRQAAPRRRWNHPDRGGGDGGLSPSRSLSSPLSALSMVLGVYVASALYLLFTVGLVGRGTACRSRSASRSASPLVLFVAVRVSCSAHRCRRAPLEAAVSAGTDGGEATCSITSPLLANGFAVAITGYHILFMMVGVFLGILVGVLPGLGAPNGVSLLMPLTFAMDPVSAIILLTSMYWGALFGGSTTSILFNIPGEPSSVATTFDGYPMAKAGRATRR